MLVNIKQLQDAIDYINEVNSQKLQDLTWFDPVTGKVIPVNPKHIDEWKFVGLNNVDFYKEGLKFEVKYEDE